jgi:two-component system, NtrC family, sensor kinase
MQLSDMLMSKNLMDIQLKEMSQLTGASWAAWMEHNVDWEIFASYKLNAKSRNAVLKYVQKPSIKAWLNGALIGKHSRSRSVSKATNLHSSRIYIFPDQMTQRVIVVGSEKLSEIAQRFWRGVALGNSNRSLLDPTTNSVLDNVDLGIPYHLPQALDRVLELILKGAACETGWLAIRSGDYFEVRAQLCCEGCSDVRISIEANPLLREITKTRRARIVEKNNLEWAMVPRTGFKASSRMWAALPLVIGQRLIGLVAFWLELPIPADEWSKLQKLAGRVAPSVEASITFSDLTNQLHRMALLNDFAVTITSALDPEQIAQRMFALLRRAFGTERINLVILSSDGSGLQDYVERDGTIILQSMPLDGESIPWLIEKGEVYRADSITPESEYKPVYPSSRSALVIPMKYRRQLIGTLGLESTREGAFTVYDEHLLMVIASHLAGLLENGRLRREAESRARNLSLIHEVVEQIINLTDVEEVAQIAAELMARNFAYELTVVILSEGPERKLTVAGIGGNAADLVQQGLRLMDDAKDDGIVMRVAVTGQNVLVNDVDQNPFYRPVPNWDAGSEMCVALKDGDRILGVIDVESQRKNAFSQNDLLVLESLAGILASAVSGAGQYQKLQATVDQLRSAREELQERIAAQRMAESKLVQAAKLAAVGEMAAGIAHELNNPLTTVSGFTELVLEELSGESDIRDDLELVLKEAQRARSVVRRLLDFARQSESMRVRSDINEILTDVLALVNHLLRTSGVQVFTHLPTGIPWIAVDRNQVKQVVLNLIHNALHAMPTGGELQITTVCRRRDKHDWLTICLADTGIGIAPENLERVFEPFFTTRSKDGGTGLGLSVSYGIIADHGGFIEVASEVGKGSTFTIWLPVEVE